MEIVGSKQNIHEGEGLPDIGNNLRLLHHASADPDDHVAILLLQRLQLSQMSI